MSWDDERSRRDVLLYDGDREGLRGFTEEVNDNLGRIDDEDGDHLDERDTGPEDES